METLSCYIMSTMQVQCCRHEARGTRHEARGMHNVTRLTCEARRGKSDSNNTSQSQLTKLKCSCTLEAIAFPGTMNAERDILLSLHVL